MTEAHSSLAPFAKLGSDIFCNENNRRRPADELVLWGIGIGRNQGKHRRPVGWCNRYPSLAGRKASIKSQMESELVQVEAQASILISNEYIDSMDTEVRFVSIEVKTGLVRL